MQNTTSNVLDKTLHGANDYRAIVKLPNSQEAEIDLKRIVKKMPEQDIQQALKKIENTKNDLETQFFIEFLLGDSELSGVDQTVEYAQKLETTLKSEALSCLCEETKRLIEVSIIDQDNIERTSTGKAKAANSTMTRKAEQQKTSAAWEKGCEDGQEEKAVIAAFIEKQPFWLKMFLRG